jgi:PhzF family phenazine biosynthesis protein
MAGAAEAPFVDARDDDNPRDRLGKPPRQTAPIDHHGVMAHTITQVDAFTDRPFTGNPAAVCVLDAPADDAWMQAVAAEMNVSETAFAVRPAEQGEPYGLRWFTPTTEVPLCGHATLATSHVLFTSGEVEAGPIRYATRSGELAATRLTDGRIELDLPADPPAPIDAPDGLLAALGLTAADVDEVLATPTRWLVVVTTRERVALLQIDQVLLSTMEGFGVVATALGDGSPYDCESRVFVIDAGIDEDPVTGAAHCVVGPYWAGRVGRDDLTAHQASARGGRLDLTIRGDRVAIAGRAVTVLQGELLT